MLRNSTKNGSKNFYVHHKLLKLPSNHIHIWRPFPVVSRVTLSNPSFQILILKKQLEIYLLFQKSLKKGGDNFYFHLHTFDESKKSFSCLESHSCHGLVNPSTPTFGNISLTETMSVMFLLLGNSLKNDCKNLYLYSKPFKLTFQSSSHLASVSWCCLVTLSTHTFPNINLTKAMTNLLTVCKITEKDYDDLDFHSCIFKMSYKSFFFSQGTFSSWSCKFVYPNFWQYQSDRNRHRFNCWFEIKSKMASRISICILNPLKLPTR